MCGCHSLQCAGDLLFTSVLAGQYRVGSSELRIHVGIGCGRISGLHVGGGQGRYALTLGSERVCPVDFLCRLEYLIAGEPIDKQLKSCEAQAQAGQCVISPQCYELVKLHFEGEVCFVAFFQEDVS